MTHTYTIHMPPYNFSLLSMPNYKKIPKHASTHYACAIQPLKPIAEKTYKGFVPHPIAQRKTTKDARPLNATQITVASTPIQKTKKKRAKFRKNINKRALAAYFDNDVKLSRTAAIQKWQDTVVAELAAADKIVAQTTYNLQADIESSFNALGISPDKIKELKANPINEIMWQEQISEYSLYDEYDIKPVDDFCVIVDANRIIDRVDNNILDIDDLTLFGPHTPEANMAINESIVDRFINKYDGADTAAAMHAFEKKKFHSTILPLLVQKKQIIK